MAAYYNEIDPYAAQWLRNLIAAGHIAPGVVDERSIEDVFPDDLRGFTQCHFFAGIGVWSYALRQAGWDDSRPVWTGSCPCQPFSDAGKGAGFADERHLWPAFFHLIGHNRPAVVFGEQVASSDAMPWLDLVQDDMEAVGYAFGAIPFPSAGVGAPHIRDRLYWVANSDNGKRSQLSDRRGQGHESGSTDSSASGGMGYPMRIRRKGPFDFPGTQQSEQSESRPESLSCGLADTGCDADRRQAEPAYYIGAEGDGSADQPGGHSCASNKWSGPTNGHWRDADWLYCRDGKWRPVEPGLEPLVNGVTNRVGRLRAYGNAINAQAARVFIESYGVTA